MSTENKKVTEKLPKDDVVRQHLWLQGGAERDAREKKRPERHPKPKDTYYDSDSDVDTSTGLTEEQVADAFKELNKLRSEWLRDLPGVRDWSVKLLGGGWTQAHCGVCGDAFIAAPSKNSDAETWSIQVGLGGAARYNLAPYTPLGARTMAETYAAKCQFFYDKYLAMGPRYQFTTGDNASFVFGCEFEHLLTVLKGRYLKRAEWLRDVYPGSGL